MNFFCVICETTTRGNNRDITIHVKSDYTFHAPCILNLSSSSGSVCTHCKQNLSVEDFPAVVLKATPKEKEPYQKRHTRLVEETEDLRNQVKLKEEEVQQLLDEIKYMERNKRKK